MIYPQLPSPKYNLNVEKLKDQVIISKIIYVNYIILSEKYILNEILFLII